MNALLDWQRCNRALIAKSIAELSYELALTPEHDVGGQFSLRLSSGIEYRFAASGGAWGRLDIEPDSLLRQGDGGLTDTDAGQFYVDAAPELQLSDADLGNLLHETANTLAADIQLAQRRARYCARELALMTDEQVQTLLDGHPKAIVNKGRIGWGAEEYRKFAPESASPRPLVWLAADPAICRVGLGKGLSWPGLLAESFSPSDIAEGPWVALLKDGYLPLPVHPWQYQHYIRHHYAAYFADGRLRYLGAIGDDYLPQVSLRTLSNCQRPRCHHIKLPITILNTSCFRGIPGDFIHCGPELSAWMAGLCRDDAELSLRGTAVMEELAGVHVPHPLHSQVPGSPYRYKEMLGATWRQSPAAHCRPGERHLLMAALLQCDAAGNSVAGALIHESGLTAPQWLRALFDVVLVPLYHLLCAYGVGLVAHAQNLTLMLDNHVPRRLLLKDFQGDLRVLDSGEAERAGLPASAAVVKRLPGAHLLHDLFTGHGVTVLRFLSTQLAREGVVAEALFYRLANAAIREYQTRHPPLAAAFARLDLLAPTLERVCINRVRLKQGYGDCIERPVPIVDGELRNPLHLYTEGEDRADLLKKENEAAL